MWQRVLAETCILTDESVQTTQTHIALVATTGSSNDCRKPSDVCETNEHATGCIHNSHQPPCNAVHK